MVIKENSLAPEFKLPDENNKIHALSDYIGKEIVLYFYPEDGTSGCTTEACNFRNDYSDYEKAGMVILGVSPDSPESHKQFKLRHHLPFPLLADVGHKVSDLYGVWGNKEGAQKFSVLRTTFLISKDGKIKKVFENVVPEEHSKEILAQR